jgi:hypothetical protein
MRHAPSLAVTLFLAAGVLTTLTAPLPGHAAPAGDAVPVGTSFTDQGRLALGGTPFTGTCDLEIRLFDAPNGGAQIGGTAAVEGLGIALVKPLSHEVGEDRRAKHAR